MPNAHTSLFDLASILESTRYLRVILALFPFEDGQTKYRHIACDFLDLAQGLTLGQGSHALAQAGD